MAIANSCQTSLSVAKDIKSREILDLHHFGTLSQVLIYLPGIVIQCRIKTVWHFVAGIRKICFQKGLWQ